MITNATLEGFQRHKDLHLDFTPGLNLIVGRNWKGKSSVLRAILYALGGSSAVRGLVAGDLQNDSTSVMRVSVSLSTPDGDILVRRGTRGAVAYSPGGHEIASGHTSVTTLVEGILGLPIYDFLLFNTVDQGEPDVLLSENGTNLSRLLYRITGIDTLDAAGKWLIETRNTSRSVVQALQEIVVSGSSCSEELNNEQKRLADQRQVLDNAKCQLDEAKAQTEAKEQTLLGLREKQKEHARYLEQVGLLKTRLQEIEAFRTAPDPPGPCPDRDSVEKVGKQVQALRLEVSELFQLEELKRQSQLSADRLVTQLNSAINDLDIAKSATETIETKPLEDEILTLQQERAVKVNEAAALDSALAVGVCPACKRPYDDSQATAADQERYDSLVESISAANSSISEKLTKLSVWRVSLKRAEDAANIVKVLEERLAEQVSYVAKYAERIGGRKAQDTSDRLEELSAHHASAMNLLATWDAHRQRIKEAEQRSEQVQRELQELVQPESVDQGVLGSMEAELVSWKAHVEQVSKWYSEERENMARIESTCEALKERLEAYSDAASRHSLALSRATSADELLKLISGSREGFLKAIWARLLGAASTFVREATGGDVTEISRDSQTGKFTYREDGQVRRSVLASGMQKAILGTALKLSLGAGFLGGNARLLLLDEVTASGDDVASVALTRLIRSASKQTLMVTHRALDASLADNVIEIE